MLNWNLEIFARNHHNHHKNAQRLWSRNESQLDCFPHSRLVLGRRGKAAGGESNPLRPGPPRSEPPAQRGSRRHASTLRDLEYRVVFSKTSDRKLAMHLVPTLSSLCVIALCPRVPDRTQDAFSATNKRSKFASLAHDSTTERIAVAVENSLGIIAICALLSRNVSNQAKLDMACAIRLAKEINGLSNLAFPKDSARRLRCASTAFQTLQALWSNAP